MKMSFFITPFIAVSIICFGNFRLSAQADTSGKNTIIIKTITIQGEDTIVKEKRITKTDKYIINEQKDNHHNYSRIVQGNLDADEIDMPESLSDDDYILMQDSMGKKLIIIEKSLDSMDQQIDCRHKDREKMMIRMMSEKPDKKDRYFNRKRDVFVDEYYPEKEAEVINKIDVYSDHRKEVVLRFDFQPINKTTSLLIKDEKGNELHKEIIKSSTNPVIREITLDLNNSGIYFVTIKQGNKAINQKIKIL